MSKNIPKDLKKTFRENPYSEDLDEEEAEDAFNAVRQKEEEEEEEVFGMKAQKIASKGRSKAQSQKKTKAKLSQPSTVKSNIIINHRIKKHHAQTHEALHSLARRIRNILNSIIQENELQNIAQNKNVTSPVRPSVYLENQNNIKKIQIEIDKLEIQLGIKNKSALKKWNAYFEATREPVQDPTRKKMFMLLKELHNIQNELKQNPKEFEKIYEEKATKRPKKNILDKIEGLVGPSHPYGSELHTNQLIQSMTREHETHIQYKPRAMSQRKQRRKTIISNKPKQER